ncbi:hypothetical protein [Massilibacteroides sp.]|uniref:hypothetical protein n=1 Tax=Massilibacteroides sp. TaxID=2034766 RepID=UPI0026278AEF|nr:hypothetical protein [Massilibacteroides sp.]MDD4516861.1 hypothetical protein [Massilibacteroides sp.]
MKRAFALFLSIFILAGCSENDEYINGLRKDIANVAKNRLVDIGINPMYTEDVTYVKFIENTDTAIYVGAIKSNAAWFAKFDKKGNLVLSYSYPNTGSPEYCSFPCRFEVFDNFIFVSISQENKTSIINNNISSYNSLYSEKTFLCVINKDGKEEKTINRSSNNTAFIGIQNTFGVLFAETNSEGVGLKLYFLNNDGSIVWSRDCKETESHFTQYRTFISEEMAILNSYGYRFIDVKNYNLKFVIDYDDLERKGDLQYQPNITYGEAKWITLSGKLYYTYPEIERITITDDPISGQSHYENIIRNQYAYEIDPETGVIISFGKDHKIKWN